VVWSAAIETMLHRNNQRIGALLVATAVCGTVRVAGSA
jgi:hypothetical protein